MHDASGKTAPHPKGAGCLCPEAHWVLLARGKNTSVLHCSRSPQLHPLCLRLRLTWRPTLPPTTTLENGGSQEPSDTVFVARGIF